MWPSPLSISPVFALVCYASAASLVSRTIPQLLARQTTFDPASIPFACQSDCFIATSFITTCVPPQPADCGCTPNEERGLVTCLNCILGVTAAPQARIDRTQSLLDQYVILCNRAGASLPGTTVRGGTSLVTSTAAQPVPSGRPGSITRPPTITSPTGSPATITPGNTNDDDDFATTSQSRIAQSTVTSPGSDSLGPSLPINGEIKPKVKVWMVAATAAGIVLVDYIMIM